MDYVELFLLFMSAVAGLKIVSDAIGRQQQQNDDVSAFCVNLVPNLDGLGCTLFWANNAIVWKSMTMTLIVVRSELLVLNGACERAVENENSFGGSSEGKSC
jgi:hypothetical protein